MYETNLIKKVNFECIPLSLDPYIPLSSSAVLVLESCSCESSSGDVDVDVDSNVDVSSVSIVVDVSLVSDVEVTVADKSVVDVSVDDFVKRPATGNWCDASDWQSAVRSFSRTVKMLSANLASRISSFAIQVRGSFGNGSAAETRYACSLSMRPLVELNHSICAAWAGLLPVKVHIIVRSLMEISRGGQPKAVIHKRKS